MEVDQATRYGGGGDISSTPSSTFEHFLGSPMSWLASSRIASAIGSPMSWRASSWGVHSASIGDLSSTHYRQGMTPSDTLKTIDQESSRLLQSGKYTCCGIYMHDIQSLFVHIDEVHSEPELIEEPDAPQRNTIQTTLNPDIHTWVDHEYMELDLESDIHLTRPRPVLINDTLTSRKAESASSFDSETLQTPLIIPLPNEMNITNSSTIQNPCGSFLNLPMASASSPLQPSSSMTTDSFMNKLFTDAASGVTQPDEMAKTRRPFRCPKPNCSKSYRQANGLKYHITYGTCRNFPLKNHLEYVKELLAHKREMMKSAHVVASSGPQGASLLGQADIKHDGDGTNNPPAPQNKISTNYSLSSILALTKDDLEHVSEEVLIRAERKAEDHRPFKCCVDNCTERYRNVNGLRYHYRSTGDHGLEGLEGLALLESGKHPYMSQFAEYLNFDEMDTVQSKSTVVKSRSDEVTVPEDLTGKVAKRSQYAAHGGSYADIFVGDYQHNAGSSKQKVAIKVIRAHIYTDANKAKMQKRLLREIYVWTRLEHPNVLPLLGTTRDFCSELAMICPWMEEGDLASYLDTNRDTLSADKRKGICEDIADGLCYVHSQNVIHGDLTTGNILMQNGRAKIGDFGLSNVIAELRGVSFQTSKAGGSARWAAPELLSVEDETTELTFQADVYSLGGVIFHVMSGKVPYEGLKESQIILNVMKKIRSPRPSGVPEITDSFWDLISSCWMIMPAFRPPTIRIAQLLKQL